MTDDAVGGIMHTCREGELVDRAEARAIEGWGAAEWQSAGRDSTDLEARRRAVTDRGRSQM